MKSPIGTIFAEKFEILSVLGQGGMSVVYKARHLMTERIVAIKLLSSHDMPSLKRFHQEAKLACTLSHPNVISVFDFGVSTDGQPFLVMDYLQGETLGESIKAHGAMDIDRALQFFIQGCDALAYAHKREVLHRDLKPGNFMITRDHDDKEVLKLVDFGIAKNLGMGAEALDLTRTGEVFGSPLYMSPEQCLGRKLDARADIYSMGCVMYEALAGVPPLVGTNAMDTLHKHINEDPEPFMLTRQHPNAVPPILEHIIFKALSRELDSRFQSMQELLVDLVNCRQTLLHGVPADTGATGPQMEIPISLMDMQPKISALQPVSDSSSVLLTAESPVSSNNAVSAPASDLLVQPVTTPAVSLPVASSADLTPLFPSETGIKSPALSVPIAVPKPVRPVAKPKMPGPMQQFAPLVIAIGAAFLFIAAFTLLSKIPALLSKNGEKSAWSPPSKQAVKQAVTPKSGGTVKITGAQFDDQLKAAEDAYENGKYDVALKGFQDLEKSARANFDGNDPRLAEVLHNLGNSYFKEDKFEEAESSLTQALNLQSKQGETSALADTMTDMALVYCAQGQMKKSETSLNKALNIHIAKSGLNSDDVADSKTALANLHIKQGRIAEAMKELKDALNIRQKEKNPSLYDLANTENCLATDYQLQNNLVKARALYQSGMKSAEKGFGPNHPLVSDSLVGLGTIDFLDNNLADAQKFFDRALVIRQASYGKNNLRTAEVLACQAILREQQGDYKEAKTYLSEALAIKKDVLGAAHPEVVRTQENYNNLLRNAENNAATKSDL